MTTTEELYDNLPNELKNIFGNQQEEVKEDGKTPYEIMRETLEKIQAISKPKH